MSSMDKTVFVPASRISPAGSTATKEEIVVELPLGIFLNGKELLTTLCSPNDLSYLAAGILVSEGLISLPEDLGPIKVDIENRRIDVESLKAGERAGRQIFRPLIASGGGKGSSSYNLESALRGCVRSEVSVSATQAAALMQAFLTRSSAYDATHGVHSAALCNPREIQLFQDDIGRHNALDKIFGECFLKNIALGDAIIITSGRISSEILLKVAKRGVPVLISKAPPTNQGVRLAGVAGITLIRVMKDGSLICYAHPGRIVPA